MKRRIKCDRTEPQCGKCIKKGIVCPGMGIRYRFNDGIAARGRFKGKDKPVLDDPESPSKPPRGTFLQFCQINLEARRGTPAMALSLDKSKSAMPFCRSGEAGSMLLIRQRSPASFLSNGHHENFSRIHAIRQQSLTTN